MAITITINGVNQTTKCQDAVLEGGRRLNYNRVAGSPATFTLSTYDRTGGAGGYRAAIDQTVVVADGATTLASGVITDIRERALSDASTGWDKGILCDITCADQNGLLLRDTYTKTYADGTTLKQVLQDLIANPLAGRSITLDGAQANGPALTGFKFVDAYIDDILNSLTTITGYVWDITPGKVLSAISPGSVSCGFSLTDGGGSIYGGVTIEQGRSENYANRVTVVAGPAAQLLITETITGNGVLDHWVLTYSPATDVNGYIISQGIVTEVGVAVRTLSPPGGGGFYTWTAATNTLTRTAGALALGQVATLLYVVQFPITVTANDAGEQAAHGIYARRFIVEDVTDLPTATQLATGLLSRSIASPAMVRVTHRKGLAKPGQSVVLTFSERNINATYMITEVSFWNEVDGSVTYVLGCVSGSTQTDSWVEYFKRGGSSASSSSAAPISGAIIPAISGMFEGDVVANSGLDNVAQGFESSLRWYTNSAGAGPAIVLGRNDLNYSWIMVADSDHGSTPGAVGKLRWLPRRRGSTIEAAMMLAEPDTGGTDDFMLLPGANANLYLGDYAALMSGLSPSDSRIEGILAANIMATSGYFERSRTTRMGEWITPAYNAGDFTASAGSWGVDAADVVTYAYTLIGKTMIVMFEIQNTDVSAAPTVLYIKIPGGFTAAKQTQNWARIRDAGGTEQAGLCAAIAGDTRLNIFKDFSSSAWTLTSGDNTTVHGQIAFEVQ